MGLTRRCTAATRTQTTGGPDEQLRSLSGSPRISLAGSRCFPLFPRLVLVVANLLSVSKRWLWTKLGLLIWKGSMLLHGATPAGRSPCAEISSRRLLSWPSTPGLRSGVFDALLARGL